MYVNYLFEPESKDVLGNDGDVSKVPVGAALAGWLSWLDHCPIHRKVVGLIPSWGTCKKQPINVFLFSLLLLPLILLLLLFFLPPSLPAHLPLSLKSKEKKCP